MQYDTQDQKNLVMMALRQLDMKLGQAEDILKIAKGLTDGDVLEPSVDVPEVPKDKDDK